MSKLPCEVVKDLFPSYIDELTSKVTNDLIEEHNAECEDCRKTLESMKNPDAEPNEQPQKKEIDYLKKTRKKNRKNVLVAILVVLAVVLGGLGVKHYFIGNTISHEYVNCIVEVDGKEINVICLTYDKNMFISGIDFKEEDGIIDISCKAVKRKNVDVDGARNAYVAENTIKEVRMGERILWVNGEHISPLTSNVYQTRHAYVGDMSANNATAQAIHMSGMLGEYTNELQTTEEPYGWHIQIKKMPQELRFLDKCYLEPAAYVLLATVENLGEVTYEFEYDNEPMTLTYTTEMANAYAGKDIKSVGKDIVEFEMFIRKSGLAGMSGTPTYEVAEYVQLQILLNTEEAIQSINGIHYVEDGREWNVTTADYRGVPYTKGDSILFMVPRELINSKLGKTQKEFYLKLEINESDNVSYNTGDGLLLSVDAIERYELELSGNAEEGYHVTLK
ncbi:MAG: DUF4825 domain-containing protein [Lachnospiraceae bacterium]|nr:DUF4825 domain-containing protein [Lachnospiraceae bacterium]